MRLRNEKIMVFGGGSGIGKAIAKRFCSLGASVAIVGRNEEKLKSAAEEIDGNVYCRAFDITDVDGHAALFSEVSAVMGGLDGFVNACGSRQRPIACTEAMQPWDITGEEWVPSQISTSKRRSFS